jgi:hypothetical protein
MEDPTVWASRSRSMGWCRRRNMRQTLLCAMP